MKCTDYKRLKSSYTATEHTSKLSAFVAGSAALDGSSSAVIASTASSGFDTFLPMIIQSSTAVPCNC